VEAPYRTCVLWKHQQWGKYYSWRQYTWYSIKSKGWISFSKERIRK